MFEGIRKIITEIFKKIKKYDIRKFVASHAMTKVNV